MCNLHKVIGDPAGLVIHTDACKGLEKAVEIVFPEAEHRECMRHLVANFKKHFKGKYLMQTFGQQRTHAARRSINTT